jgi:crossover junction endodeoxyribonuclease RuvC
VNTSQDADGTLLRVMGVDPGLADTGYGVIEWDRRARRARLVCCGVVQTAAGAPVAERLQEIHRRIAAIAARESPAVIAVEILFFAANTQTAMAVAHGRAAAILGAAPGRALVEYTPLQIKKALTGHGRAGKLQVQMMVRTLLGLAEIPRPDHAADALGAALCYVHSIALDAKKSRAREALAEAEATAPGGKPAANPLKALLAQARGAGRSRRRR